MDDLVKRLRYTKVCGDPDRKGIVPTCLNNPDGPEAATAIETLTRERDEARALYEEERSRHAANVSVQQGHIDAATRRAETARAERDGMRDQERLSREQWTLCSAKWEAAEARSTALGAEVERLRRTAEEGARKMRNECAIVAGGFDFSAVPNLHLSELDAAKCALEIQADILAIPLPAKEAP